jgi:hypothetical protein
MTQHAPRTQHATCHNRTHPKPRQVYKGRRRCTGQITAMKFILKHGKSDKDIRNLRQVRVSVCACVQATQLSAETHAAAQHALDSSRDALQPSSWRARTRPGS